MKPFSEESCGDCRITVYLGSRLRKPGFVIDFYDGEKKTRYPKWPEALEFRGVCGAPERLMDGPVSEEGKEFLNNLKKRWSEVASCSKNRDFFEMLREGSDAYKILEEDEDLQSQNASLKKAVQELRDELEIYKQENLEFKEALTLKVAVDSLAGNDRKLAERYIRFLKGCVKGPVSSKEPGRKYGGPTDHHNVKGVDEKKICERLSQIDYVDLIVRKGIVRSVKKPSINVAGKDSINITLTGKDGGGLKFLVKTTAKNTFQLTYYVLDLGKELGILK